MRTLRAREVDSCLNSCCSRTNSPYTIDAAAVAAVAAAAAVVDARGAFGNFERFEFEVQSHFGSALSTAAAAAAAVDLCKPNFANSFEDQLADNLVNIVVLGTVSH